MITIIRRNREEFESFNFADFMDRAVSEARGFWHENFHESFFLFLEKRIRNVRVFFLKAESKLLRASARIRGIKEKNGTNGNGHSGDSDTPSKI